MTVVKYCMFSALHSLSFGDWRAARTGASLMGHDGSRHVARGHQKPLLGQEVELCTTTCEFVPAGQRGSLTPQLLPSEACLLVVVVDETGAHVRVVKEAVSHFSPLCKRKMHINESVTSRI